MKNLIRSISLSLFLAAGLAYGAVPPLNVTVSDASGKAAFKGSTDRSGAFATAKLKPGNYVVQFNSPNGIQGNYSIVVAAGVKKVSASGIAGSRFAKGGVAMKLDVGNLLNIVGQVATEEKSSSTPMGTNGKPMVWIPKQTGSNMPAHWAESDSGEAKQAQTSGSMSTKNIQDRQSQGVSPGR